MKKILIVSGHPDMNDSFANKTILEETKKLLPEAELVYLDQLYPDFRIDTKAEQERLLRADIIVLQYLCSGTVRPRCCTAGLSRPSRTGFRMAVQGTN